MARMRNSKTYVLALDTANEVVALGLGVLEADTRTVECVRSLRIPAHRASNTRLLTEVEKLMAQAGVSRESLGALSCGRGPGSFTGVRIAISTAKGISSALEVPLVGISTLDAIAWQMQAAGRRGRVLVLADAMRKEVYPVRFDLSDTGVCRLDADAVVKAEAAAEALGETDLFIAGDALGKYAGLFEPHGTLAPEELWAAEGNGLLAALQADWRAGLCDPFDVRRHDPAYLLPVYTRLSDAEENERKRLADAMPRDLRTGVQHGGRKAAGVKGATGACWVAGGDQGAVAGDAAPAGAAVGPGRDSGAGCDARGVAEAQGAYEFRPLDGAHAAEVAGLESDIMGSDAWTERMVLDELPRTDRTWWAAYDRATGGLAAYGGGLVVAGQLQILKVGTAAAHRRRGLARAILARIAADARALGAKEMTLEVRASNAAARSLYRALGLQEVGTRPRYYSDREDALIMTGPLPEEGRDVAGMELFSTVNGGARAGDGVDAAASAQAASAAPAEEQPVRPLLLAIESSCDETAAAIVDGAGTILADVVASQIDFHARFGGVVPEIASRKHVEAICGVTQACLEQAAQRLGRDSLRWSDLDALSATYAPGLVGALVVGVAFAKGAAWAAGIPFIKVNHLEGHLYANKIGRADIRPPMVCSLVSGGNTMLVHVRDWGDYRVLGGTIDDAVGEAFDKVAKALGLGYPGGPVISRLAEEGNPKAIRFPRAMMHSGDLRFSLSGLKTAVITYINQQREAGGELNLPDIAASFEAAVVDVQVAKAATALRETGAREFCLGGGVAANPALRRAYEKMCVREGVRLTMPPMSACTDNAAMIALAALDRFHAGRFSGLETDCAARTDLEERY